jgi:L-ascorbate metabolism protein UlaG (beta-lactamase superfamily)
MKVSIQLFGHAACRFEIDGISVWFNLSHAWASAGDAASELAADWCLLTQADAGQAHAVANWAASTPKTRFVAPHSVARALISAGLPAERVCSGGAEPLALTPTLCLRAVIALAPKTTQPKEHTSYLLNSSAGTLLLVCAANVHLTNLAALQAAGPIDTAFLPIGESSLAGTPGNQSNNTLGDMPAPLTARAAFHLAQSLGVRQVVAACTYTTNQALYPEELRLVHGRMGAQFNLLLSPTQLQIGPARASVVVRTLNEARYLGELLEGIAIQQTDGLDFEVVLVDSGSTDDTLAIAEHYGCRILHITREEFSFGRSLNMGCEAASGDILVITSGHCVPADPHWLQALCHPLMEGHAQYSYGKQLGGGQSHFSECRVFDKYFPGSHAFRSRVSIATMPILLCSNQPGSATVLTKNLPVWKIWNWPSAW